MLPAIDARPGVVEANLFIGFGWNDLPWCGMKAVVTTEQDPALARAIAREIAAAAWAARRGFVVHMETAGVRDGLERAAADPRRGIYLSDSGDNTTAGAGGDLTFVLQEAVALGVDDVVVAGIYDPAAVAACRAAGVGATLDLEIGRHVSAPPRPARLAAVVEALGERVDTGGSANLRPSEAAWARVRFGGVIATFHAARVSYVGPGHLAAVGIHPTSHKAYVVKLGYLHPALEDIAARHICLLSPGVSDLDFLRLSYRRVPRPCFPLDDAMEWAPPA
jgi:microcystin degradation protein MlrC